MLCVLVLVITLLCIGYPSKIYLYISIDLMIILYLKAYFTANVCIFSSAKRTFIPIQIFLQRDLHFFPSGFINFWHKYCQNAMVFMLRRLEPTSLSICIERLFSCFILAGKRRILNQSLTVNFSMFDDDFETHQFMTPLNGSIF